MTTQYESQTHLGLQFNDTDGQLFTSWQLLNAQRQAIAIANFRGKQLERFEYSVVSFKQAQEWLEYLKLEKLPGLAR